MADSMEGYDIRFCRETEIDQLCQFIDKHWQKGHVLAVNRKLMDWQHYDAEKKRYNFVIAKHKASNKIHGVLGFISPRHFDNMLTAEDIWLVVWKIRDDIQVSGLGLSLLNSLISLTNPRSIGAIGLNTQVVPIYKLLRYKTGKLNHYYIVNNKIKDFKIIGDFDGCYHNQSISEKEKSLILYEKDDFVKLSRDVDRIASARQIPEKSINYIVRRYFEHPVYQYYLYAAKDCDGKISAFFVLREVCHDSSKALRIVDFIGDPQGLSGTLTGFQSLLSDSNAEYVDFYNLGIDEEIIIGGGFIKLNGSQKVIIPNYFEPFVKKNIDLLYAYKCENDYIICKGDSDQDRPNSV